MMSVRRKGSSSRLDLDVDLEESSRVLQEQHPGHDPEESHDQAESFGHGRGRCLDLGQLDRGVRIGEDLDRLGRHHSRGL